MTIFMIFVIIISVASTSAVISVKVSERRRAQVPQPNPAPARSPKLITSNERWMMENEHTIWPDRKFDHFGCRVCGPGALGRNEVPSIYNHKFYKVVLRQDRYSTYKMNKPTTAKDATIVSSEIEGSKMHTVMLDIDIPARLIESSTPGHSHLYIDQPMTWKQYKVLLRALVNAGVIQPGYYKSSRSHNATHLRPPWVEKEKP